jgi:signal transduction histidine kinase
VIDRVLQLLSPQKRLKSVIIVQEEVTPGLRAEIDPQKLEQILVNLILNAADAMNSEGSLRLRAEIMGPYVHLAVTDEGPGISAGAQERIFEPFFTTKIEGEGTGLGLAISRHIAVSHAGDVYVESTGPEGTTFIVQLWRDDWDDLEEDGPAESS